MYWFSWRMARTLFQIFGGYKLIHLERVPMEGPIILAANHQLNLDSAVVSVSIRREMHFFAKKELFDIFLLGWWVRQHNSIPVRRGTYDSAAISRAEEVLKAGGGLILFPEGTRGDGKEFLKPKPGIGMIARRNLVTIVPAYISGTESLLRTILRRRLRVFFGEPIRPDEIAKFADDKEGYRELAALVMERIGQLKAEALAGE